MTKLAISPDLKLPLDAVTQTIGILGRRGSGKTTTARDLVEEMLKAELPVDIIDPTDAWYGLRSSADGKREAFPITVLGGDFGDAPLEETAGKVIADLIAEQAVPMVLSTAALSKSGARRFVADFCERLYEKNRTAMHLVLDEADEFAPQNFRGDMARTFGAVDTLVRRGRKRGIGVSMLSQRSAAINKDILSQCEVLIAHRTSHPRDLEPILEWMNVHATKEQLEEVRSTIAKLKDGEAWVMSPEWLDYFGRVQMRLGETFDSGSTPEAGKRLVTPKKLAAVDLKLLHERMADTIERAKATDPRLLQRRVAELERELAKKDAFVAEVDKRTKVIDEKLARVKPPRRVEVPILKDGHVQRLEQAILKAATAAAAVEAAAKTIGEAISRPLAANGPAPAVPSSMRNAEAIEKATRDAVPARAWTPPSRPRREPAADGEPNGLKKGARSMLQALASFYPRDLTRQELGVHAEISYVTGTFSDYLSALRSAGYIEDAPGGKIAMTEQGHVAALQLFGDQVSRKTTSELVGAWGPKLKGASRRMFEALVAANGEPLTREQIAERAGISAETGTFSDYLSLLRRAAVIVDHGREIAAAPALFLAPG